jgi:hypothetical protein
LRWPIHTPTSSVRPSSLNPPSSPWSPESRPHQRPASATLCAQRRSRRHRSDHDDQGPSDSARRSRRNRSRTSRGPRLICMPARPGRCGRANRGHLRGRNLAGNTLGAADAANASTTPFSKLGKGSGQSAHPGRPPLRLAPALLPPVLHSCRVAASSTE